MIEKDEADLRSISQQVSCLNRDWLLARLRRIHAVAMGDEPVGVNAAGEGDENGNDRSNRARKTGPDL